MVKNPLDMVERNIEICCSEMTKNPHKNFYHSCRHFFEICLPKWSALLSLRPTFKNPNFESMDELGKVCLKFHW